MAPKSSLFALVGLSTFSLCKAYTVGFGAEWWTNSQNSEGSDVYIVSTNTTLVVPAAPNPQVDRLFLWPGLETQGNGLVQSIVGSYGDPGSVCNGQPGQWCAYASYNDGITNQQTDGDRVAVNEGDQVQIEYSYDDSTQQTTQWVYVNGNQVSTLVDGGGRPYAWNAATECQDGNSGTMPAYSYINTQIALSQADPNWGATLYTAGASDSGLTTPDGGLTWYVDKIDMSDYTCTPQ